ncbi:unnamed protein product [Linum trigynum]|uniref:Uncharacterized protein n=1 Tax=Linum trigynum TaxID=586398 RepID=A0AAV2DB33_9ROSI
MITRLLLALPLNLSAYRTESPTLWLNADEVLNEIGIAVEGEDDDPFVHWISSDSELEDEAVAGEVSVEQEAPEDQAPIASFAAALQDLYGSSSESDLEPFTAAALDDPVSSEDSSDP